MQLHPVLCIYREVKIIKETAAAAKQKPSDAVAIVSYDETHSTTQHLLVRNLVERDHATDFVLTHGRSVLDALIRKARPE